MALGYGRCSGCSGVLDMFADLFGEASVGSVLPEICICITCYVVFRDLAVGNWHLEDFNCEGHSSLVDWAALGSLIRLAGLLWVSAQILGKQHERDDDCL